MDNCGTWRNSYRFALAIIQELPNTPQFLDEDLNADGVAINAETREDAVWEYPFTADSAAKG
jgi:hypothetical protein